MLILVVIFLISLKNDEDQAYLQEIWLKIEEVEQVRLIAVQLPSRSNLED